MGRATCEKPTAHGQESPLGFATYRIAMAELGPRMDELLHAARRRFTLLAVAAAVDSVIVAALLARAVGSDWHVGAVIGAVVAAIVSLVIHDWGRKLDHKPRGLHLVKARGWAAIMILLPPLGPFVAPGLLRLLTDPVLARHAVANHPDFGKVSDESVIATIRVRSAMITMRGSSLVYMLAGLLLATVGPSATNHSRQATLVVGLGTMVTVVALLQLVVAVVGSRLLREINSDTTRRVANLAWLLSPALPFGPWATWSAHRAAAHHPVGAPPEI